ncbi:MAG TPA: ribonuclease domain-containing protein [Holophagaceae bacterium]|nr:ribonuclease domain-containing protein [Holophagaceae bacterium]
MNFLRRLTTTALLMGMALACGHAPQPPRPGVPTVQAVPSDPALPANAIQVLAYIRAHHEAPLGYEGSRRFGNYEEVLPQADGNGRRIQYQEWDVHPHREHVNRGAERIVTGSDGRAWYTGDHYAHFTEMP